MVTPRQYTNGGQTSPKAPTSATSLLVATPSCHHSTALELCATYAVDVFYQTAKFSAYSVFYALLCSTPQDTKKKKNI